MVYAESFEASMSNQSKVLHRCIESNLVLNFEKCHFMVTKGIVLGHLVSARGIEVDKAKIDVISSLSNPTSVREVHSFLGHESFYRQFIKDFNKIPLPLSKLLQKDVDFVFDHPCVDTFQELKKRLTSMPILQAPNWELPFKLMCDVSNSALGAVLGQRVGKQPHVIAYASRTMDLAQVNYTTSEKELLATMFSLDKFRSHLLGSKGVENTIADHLSQLEREVDPILIRDEFPDEKILRMTHATPRYANICNYLVASTYSVGASKVVKERLESDAKYYSNSSSNRSSTSVMRQPGEAIMDLVEQPGKSLIVGCIGPPYSETCTNSSQPASNARKPEWP
ncbi:Retrovirus-related Pol polyprotein from transposon opus, partial [Mucuna pruriens]